MERNSVYLFKVFGIPIRVHVSWLIIFALITLILAANYFPNESHHQWAAWIYWVLGIVTSLLFFVSVLLHELAHSVVARRRGMKVRDIVLFIFGGVSELGDEPGSAATEFIMAFVGPLTSFVLGGLSLLLYWLTRDVSEPVSAIANYLGFINILLGIFNLIPGFPLDGGRVLRAILWGITGDLQRSTRWASRMGSFFAYAFIFVGIFWMVFAEGLLERPLVHLHRLVPQQRRAEQLQQHARQARPRRPHGERDRQPQLPEDCRRTCRWTRWSTTISWRKGCAACRWSRASGCSGW